MPLALAALTVGFYWKMVFLGRTIGGLDVLDYFYPYRAYAHDAIQSGRLPLWNPDIFGGAPFLANIQSALFYPPSALFYLMSEPVAYTWSVVVHTFLGGLFAYLFGRQSLGLGRLGAFVAALAFAFSGFMGGQMDHLNQLSAAVWLPALLLCWDKAADGRLLYGLLGALVVAVQFLAGHPQESYLMLGVLALYAAYRIVTAGEDWYRARLLHGALSLVGMLALGAALAGVQLLPTLELTSWSIRANGLTYQQATAVSLKGTMLLNALLPPFWNPNWLSIPPNTEFLGYVGVTALVLALAALVYGRRRHALFFALLAGVGIFLALGQQNPFYPALFRFVPGFNVLRVPARWLFVYSFGVAVLAGLGADALRQPKAKPHWRPMLLLLVLPSAAGVWLSRIDELPQFNTRLAWVGFGLVAVALAFTAMRWRRLAIGSAALLVAELWLAGQSLGYSHPTPNEVFNEYPAPLDILRSAPAGYRVLSVAEDTYAPAIEPRLRQQYASGLSDQEILDYLRDYKLREILEPDTTMAAGIATIDGYDGGLLPLGRYAEFKDLLTELPSAPDDRIRFVVKWLPNRSLMDVAGVRFVVTDALQDKEVSGVRYDLSSFIHVDAQHPRATLTLNEPHPASSIGVVVAAKPVVPLPSDRIVATLTVNDDTGKSASVPIPAGGLDVGQLAYREKLPDRVTVTQLEAPLSVSSLTVTLGDAPTTEAFINGLALIGTTGSYSPLAAPGSEIKKVSQGDVKVYENSAALPAAFMVHMAVAADTPEQAAMAMGGGFDPAGAAVIEGSPQPPLGSSLLARMSRKVRQALAPVQPFTLPQAWLASSPGVANDQVRVDSLEPERVAITTTSDQAGFLILTQSFYPGWQVTVDGQQAPLMAADTLFQAVHLNAGPHHVEFVFRPRTVVLGAALSGAAALVWLASLVLWWVRRPTG